MSQTPGGSSGDLELLKRIDIAEERIQDIVNVNSVTFSPMNENINIDRMYRNDTMFTFPNISVSVPSSVPKMKIGNVDFFVFGKVNNSNPLRLVDGARISGTCLQMRYENSRWYVHTYQNMFVHYDGVDTYLLATEFGASDAYSEALIPVQVRLYNSQLK